MVKKLMGTFLEFLGLKGRLSVTPVKHGDKIELLGRIDLGGNSMVSKRGWFSLRIEDEEELTAEEYAEEVERLWTGFVADFLTDAARECGIIGDDQKFSFDRKVCFDRGEATTGSWTLVRVGSVDFDLEDVGNDGFLTLAIPISGQVKIGTIGKTFPRYDDLEGWGKLVEEIGGWIFGYTIPILSCVSGQ